MDHRKRVWQRAFYVFRSPFQVLVFDTMFNARHLALGKSWMRSNLCFLKCTHELRATLQETTANCTLLRLWAWSRLFNMVGRLPNHSLFGYRHGTTNLALVISGREKGRAATDSSRLKHGTRSAGRKRTVSRSSRCLRVTWFDPKQHPDTPCMACLRTLGWF